MKDLDWRVQDLNLRKGSVQQVFEGARVEGVRVQGLAWGQSSRCLRGPTRERWDRLVSEFPSVSRQLWHTYVSGTWLLRILAHDRWIQVLHLLHSIMARPAKGFMQKHVTRSHESSSEATEENTWSVQLCHFVECLTLNMWTKTALTWVDHYVFILSWSVLVSEHYLFPLAKHCSAPWKSLHLLYLYHSLLQVSAFPVWVLITGLLFAGVGAVQMLGMEGNADIILWLFFDHFATVGDAVLQLWNRWVGLLDPAFLPTWILPLLSPSLFLQLVGFWAVVWMQGRKRMLQKNKQKTRLCVKSDESEPSLDKWCHIKLTHIFLGVAGKSGSWLRTLSAPVLGGLRGPLGARGWGSWCPAITVCCAAGTVRGAGTTAQWRVLKTKMKKLGQMAVWG